MIFTFQSSKNFLFYRVAVFLFAGVSLWLTFSMWIFCTGVGLIILFALHEKDKPRWLSIDYKAENEWILESATEGIVRAKLLSSSVMMRYLLILQFEDLQWKQKKVVVVFSDQLLFKEYRALRRCVRY